MRLNSALSGFGKGVRLSLIAIGALAFIGGAIAFADFTLTQGLGTTFSSLVIAGKQYVTYIICDATLGQTQCAAVDANKGLKIAGEGTAGVATGGVVTVQGVASMTPVQVSQATGSNLNAVVTQPTAANLNTTATQPTAANLNATVVQGTASSLNATVIQPTATALQATEANSSAILAGVQAPEANSAAILAGVQAPEANSAAILAAVSSSIPTGANVVGYTTTDPCGQSAKSFAPINQTGSKVVVTGVALTKTYICSIDFVTATMQNIALVEGTGSTCGTDTYGLAGGATAALGWNVVSNTSISRGNGTGTVYSGTADANHVGADTCLLLSGSGQTSGSIGYVQTSNTSIP